MMKKSCPKINQNQDKSKILTAQKQPQELKDKLLEVIRAKKNFLLDGKTTRGRMR